MSRHGDPLREKWRRFRRLSPEERSLFLGALALLPPTMLGLRTIGFRRWKNWVERFWTPKRPAGGTQRVPQLEMAKKTARAVRSAELHGPLRPNCLERSMVLWWLLRTRGMNGELHIGARMKQAQFEAHAWVELGGLVLNDSPEVHEHYSRFDAPIAAAETDTH
jgi:Transglutaminase-like superfamily